jgi:hypothetical protein
VGLGLPGVPLNPVSAIQWLGLYARTLAGLRPAQWVHLPVRRLQARLPARVPEPSVRLNDAALASAVETIGVDRPGEVVERAEAIIGGTFTFLGHTEEVPEIDWSRRYVSHLWSYNLHYFDYARDLAWAHRESDSDRYADAFTELALAWVRGNELGRGDGWEPYAVSLRVVNWLYTLTLLGDAVPAAARTEIATSLGRQAAWLERRPEKHIQANHLQKNWLALAVAGLFLEGKAVARWRRKGLEGSWGAVRSQVLDDGVHFERSPMYHAIALADFLELIVLCEAAGEPVPADVRERVGRMVEAFGVLSRPDGSLHLFNDAANGIAPSRPHLDRLSRHVLGRGVPAGEGVLDLPEAGLFGLHEQESGDRLLIDCGAPGPRFQPGHAHCDTLSFELDIHGAPAVVDAGVHGYGGDPHREYVRSTRAHNTVMIGGKEQHEVWGTYRMARRGTVRAAGHSGPVAAYRFEGAFTPYHDRRAAHHRVIERMGRNIRVFDRVSGAEGDPINSFLHLAPGIRLEPVEGGFAASIAGQPVVIRLFGIDRVRTATGVHCPEFGRAIDAPVIEMEVHANDGREFGYEIRIAGEAS